MHVTKEFTFDSAHKLDNYNGKCANLHGHTYKLQVTIKGEVKGSGMVLDFVKVKEIIDRRIIEKLDHRYLNDTIKQPTVENIVIWILGHLKDDLPLFEIKLWETPTSFVTYKGE